MPSFPLTSGLTAMALSCFFSAGMGAFLCRAHQLDPSVSCLAASFIRAVCNSALVVVLAKQSKLSLWGDRRPSLWIWGALGAVTLCTYVAAIQRLGMGEATFLNQAVSAVVLTTLSPFFLGQRNSVFSWIAIAGAMLGLYLLQMSHAASADRMGVVLALISGVSTGAAYLLLSRAGMSVDPLVVMFYWCFACLAFHAGSFFLTPIVWPTSLNVWLCLIGSGVLATIAQYFYTLAYQIGPAAPVTAVGYLGPVLGTAFDVSLFGFALGPRGYVGALFVLAFAVVLPFTREGASIESRAPAVADFT